MNRQAAASGGGHGGAVGCAAEGLDRHVAPGRDVFGGRNARSQEIIGENAACYEQVEIDYDTQMKHVQEILIGRILSIHYDVTKLFGILIIGENARSQEIIKEKGASYEQVEIDYGTQMKHVQEILIRRILSIHYDVTKLFGILIFEGLERFGRLGEGGAHSYIVSFLAIIRIGEKQEILRFVMECFTDHTSSMPSIIYNKRHC